MKTTILTCTANSGSALFKKHLNALKKHTENYELLIFDNHNSTDFNHAAEINRAIKIAKGEYLVILDDDLIVTKNWLKGLLKTASKKDVKVVGGIHRYLNNEINHAGAYLQLDGYSRHYVKPLKQMSFFPYVCSAVMLIDLKFIKENKIKFSEVFKKYYQEVDFCLKVWEKGGKVACTPMCDVYHLVGKTATKKTATSQILADDLKFFQKKWVKTEKLHKVLIKNERKLNFGGFKMMSTFDKVLTLYRKASKQRSIKLFKEVIQLNKPILKYDFGKEFAGGASFHIGKLLKNNGEISRAKNWFQKCLVFLPDHRQAKKYIMT